MLVPRSCDSNWPQEIHVSIPDDFEVDLDANLRGGLTIHGGNAHGIRILQIPKLAIGLDPVNLTVQPLEVALKPIDLWVGLKEVPRIRGHIPANFSLCFALFGRELVSVRLCGEAQVITEPYDPNPCEGTSRRDDRLKAVLKLKDG
jgi:hypothetical protein